MQKLPVRYEIRVANMYPLRLTEIQFDDLRNALMEHVRNGFRDGWCRMGSATITEVGLPQKD